MWEKGMKELLEGGEVGRSSRSGGGRGWDM